jgi:hypothetical protein
MDSNPNAYSLQPENAIAVPPWKGDPNDTFLIDILPMLERMHAILIFIIFYLFLFDDKLTFKLLLNSIK